MSQLRSPNPEPIVDRPEIESPGSERGTGAPLRVDDHFLRAVLDPTGCGADVATVQVPVRELADLRRKLESQPVIEQAKGIVMGYYGVDPDTAFNILVRWSQTGNVKLRTVAEGLAEAVHRRPGEHPPPHELIDEILLRCQN